MAEMYNNKNIKKIAAVLCWIIVIAMVLSTCSYFVFAEEADGIELAGENRNPQGNWTPQVISETAISLDGQISDDPAVTDEDLEFLKNLMQFIKEQYVEQVSTEELLNGAYQGMLKSLDPYCVYYVEREDRNAFSDYATGTFYGLGISLKKDDYGVKIADFTGNSTGKRAGLEAGDYIIEIDGADVREAELGAVVALLRGDHGSYVKVKVDRNGTLLEFDAVRGPIQKQSTVAGMLDESVGYIGITGFYANTASEVRSDWEALKTEHPEMTGLVVDVRNNLGGVVDAAIGTAELFLNPGDEIMHYIKRGEVMATYAAEKEKLIDVPVVVLINENSASATEIFAGALQDNEAAALVGTTTYGKGAAQVIYNLKDDDSMKLTVLHFVTPKQNPINQVGIEPDYKVENYSQTAMQEKMKTIGVLAPMKEERKYGKGEMGLNVFAAQQRLLILGEEDLEVNGVLDEKTFEAVKQLQAESGLYVYGVLDFATMKALNDAIEQKLNGVELDDQLNQAMELLK